MSRALGAPMSYAIVTELVRRLNKLNDRDPVAMASLLSLSLECERDADTAGDADNPQLEVLGLLNALAGAENNPCAIQLWAHDAEEPFRVCSGWKPGSKGEDVYGACGISAMESAISSDKEKPTREVLQPLEGLVRDEYDITHEYTEPHFAICEALCILTQQWMNISQKPYQERKISLNAIRLSMLKQVESLPASHTFGREQKED